MRQQVIALALLCNAVVACDSNPTGEKRTHATTHRVVITPSTFLPPSSPLSSAELRAAIDDMGRAWSYPTLSCTSLDIVSAAPAARRLVAHDGVNLVVFRASAWCHNERCGGKATFPLRAAAMTTVFPGGALGVDVREGDIEINATHPAWLTNDRPDQPNLRSVLLHELGHVLGFPDLEPLPEGAPPDSVMREGTVAVQLFPRDVRATCLRYPR